MVRWAPFPVIVTTRIISFLVGNPYKPSFPLLLGRGTTQIIDNFLRYNCTQEVQADQTLPLCRIGNPCSGPWIIPKTSHFVWLTGLPGCMVLSLQAFFLKAANGTNSRNLKREGLHIALKLGQKQFHLFPSIVWRQFLSNRLTMLTHLYLGLSPCPGCQSPSGLIMNHF